MPVPADGGGPPVVVDAQELRGLARAARSARSDVDHVLTRVGGIMGPLDRRGWNAGAADGTWSGARSGIQTLETDLDQHAVILEARAAIVDYFENGQLCGGVPWGVSINDPVNSFSGNLFHSATDLALPTRGEVALSLVRAYNSRDTHVGLFGKGWTSTLEARVDDVLDGVVFVRSSDGRMERHDRTADGGYQPGWATHNVLSRNPAGWRLTTPDRQWLEFSSDGCLEHLGDRNDNVLSVERHRNGRVARLADALGRWLSFTYDPLGRLAATVDSAGRTVTYGYAGSGQLVSVTDPLGATTRYDYDDEGRLERVIDALGQVVLANRYDADDRVVEQVDAVGGGSQFVYGGPPSGRTTVMTDARGSTVSIEHDERGLVSRVVDAAGHETVYKYTSCGNRSSIRNRNGQLWIFEYSDDCSPVGMVDPDGGRTTFAYDPDGNVVARTDQMGSTWRYDYDARGNLVAATDPSGGRTRAELGEFGQTLRITDADGVWTRYRYNQFGDLVESTSASGAVRYEHDTAGRRIARIDPNGRISRATYDASGRLATMTDPLGNVAALEHDRVGNAQRLIYPDGATTAIAYDAANRPQRVTDALGSHVLLEYDANGNRAAFTDPAGFTARATYDQLDRVVDVLDPKGGRWRRAYDPEGNLIEAVDARGHRAAFAHTWRGQVERVTDRAGNVTELAFDLAGRMMSMTAPDGQTRRFEYDTAGRLVTGIDALGGCTRHEYTPAGRRAAVVDASGRRVGFQYDAAGRLEVLTDPTGKQTHFAHDGVGNLVKLTDRTGATTTFAYDDLDRRVTMTDALRNTTRFVYDAASNLVARQDARGQVTRFDYDAVGRLVGVIDPLGGRTSYEYDPRGPLTRHVDANGHVREYAYDANAWLAAFTDPLGRRTAFVTDPNGNRVQTADALSGLTRSTFDVEDREVGVAFPDGQAVELAYDPAGRRISMRDGLGVTRYHYDRLGRLDAVVDPFGSALGYTYDAHGQRLSTIYPDGRTVRYEYDERDRLVHVLDWLGGEHRYEYDESGQVARAALANGSGWQIDRDLLGRPRQMRHLGPSGETLAEFAYEFDSVGNLIAAEESLGRTPAARSTYRYDELARLITAEDPLGETRFSYDAVGNRLSVTNPSMPPVVAEYDAADQLVRLSAADGSMVSIDYDARGNPLVRQGANGKTHYTWDAAGHLTAVRSTDGAQTTYQYDGEGNLLAERRSTAQGQLSERRLTVDVARALPEVVSVADGDKTTGFVYGLGRVASLEVGSDEPHYFVPDLRGSVRMVANADGDRLEQRAYDTWGVPRADDAGTSPFGFTGELQDPADGLLYLRARWYEPAIGRLLSPDPLPGQLGAPMSQHPYLYAHANPTSMVDPSGLSASGVGGPNVGMPGPGGGLPPWINWLSPLLPGDPLSAVNTFTGALAKGRFDFLNARVDALTKQALETWDSGVASAFRANDFLTLADSPSSSLFMRLPGLSNLRSGYYNWRAQAPINTADSLFKESSALKSEASTLAGESQSLGRTVTALKVTGVAIDAGFAGYGQWQSDSQKHIALATKITDTATTAAWTAGLSYGGGALGAGLCGGSVVLAWAAAGCAMAGGYLGGKVAGVTAKYVDAGANWVRGAAVDSYNWAKKNLCFWC